MALEEVIDQAELEGGFQRACTEQIAQEVVDDEEFEFRVEIATALGWGGHLFSWRRLLKGDKDTDICLPRHGTR